MKTMGAFEAKTYLSKMLAEVEATGQRFIIKKRGKNIALLIPYDEKRNKTEAQAMDFLKEFGVFCLAAGISKP